MRVFTESDVENGDNTYPYGGGPNSVEAVEWYAHPDYETAPFWFNDVGVVILEEPGVVLDNAYYAELPEADQLDQLKTRRGRQETWFTAVGYGLQRINPVFVESERIRMVADRRADVACIDSTLLDMLRARRSATIDSVRVIENVGPYPAPPVVAAPAVAAAVRAKLLGLAAELSGRALLEAWGVRRFAPVTATDYLGLGK